MQGGGQAAERRKRRRREAGEERALWVLERLGQGKQQPSTLRKKYSALTIENTVNDRSMRRYDHRSPL